jgi:hypothetical protein
LCGPGVNAESRADLVEDDYMIAKDHYSLKAQYIVSEGLSVQVYPVNIPLMASRSMYRSVQFCLKIAYMIDLISLTLRILMQINL